MGVIAKGIPRGCQGLFTPVSLGYPLSVFNKNSTLKPFNGAWFCGVENKAFWSCYEETRGGIKGRPAVFFENMMLVHKSMKRKAEEEAAAAEPTVPKEASRA